MKSSNEINVGLNDTDPVNAIIDQHLPEAFREAHCRRAAGKEMI